MNTPTPPILTKTAPKTARKVKSLTSTITPRLHETSKLKPASLDLSSSNSAFEKISKPPYISDNPPSEEDFDVIKPKTLTSSITPNFSKSYKKTSLNTSSSSAFNKTLGGKYKKSKKTRKSKKIIKSKKRKIIKLALNKKV